MYQDAPRELNNIAFEASGPALSARATLVLARYRPWPATGGAALRNWQNIRALAELGPVDVLTIGPGSGAAAPEPVRTWIHLQAEAPPRAWQRVRRWARWLSDTQHPWAMALGHPEALATVREHVRSAGIGRALLEEVWFQPFQCEFARLGVSTIFDAHNAEAHLRRELAGTASRADRGWRPRRLLQQLEALERDLVRHADQTWCCSAEDARILGTLAPGRPVRVVPNTVDVASYRPLRESRSTSAIPVVTYLGAYSYAPNAEAARILVERVLPALERSGTELTLALVGRDPTEWMRAAQTRSARIRVTGMVEDVRPHLAQADVLAVPLLHGGGTRLKILEAFAAGCPVVSTPKGAEGLEVVDGEHLLLRPVEDFPEAIRTLLEDRPRATALARSALDLVEERYSWRAASTAIHAAVAELPVR